MSDTNFGILPGAAMIGVGVGLAVDTPLMFAHALTPTVFLWTWIPVFIWAILCAIADFSTRITSNHKPTAREVTIPKTHQAGVIRRDHDGKIVNYPR